MAGDWNLEASTDGMNWDVLHESRGRSPLYKSIREPERIKLWNKIKIYNGVDRKDSLSVLPAKKGIKKGIKSRFYCNELDDNASPQHT